MNTEHLATARRSNVNLDSVIRAKEIHETGTPDFDGSELSAKFAKYYKTGQRIKVSDWKEVTGTVGMSTGWRPVFLLIPRSDSVGSSIVLKDDTELIAEQIGGKYVAVRSVVRS